VGGEVVVVPGGEVVEVVGGEVVLVVAVEGAGTSTRYAATAAMTRITTMIATVKVVLMALRLLVFILIFISSFKIIKALAAHGKGQITQRSAWQRAGVSVPSILSQTYVQRDASS